MPHVTRPPVRSSDVLHVVLRLRDGLPSLRNHVTHRILMRCFETSNRDDFRLVHYSVQVEHLHLICEADDDAALSNGMHGMKIRIARALNRHWGRSGQVFDGRYFSRALRTPLEVRRGILYTLNNARNHGIFHSCPDPFSSAPWSDVWAEDVEFIGVGTVRPVVPPQTWLLREGWLRHGRIGIIENPKGDAKRRRWRRRRRS